MAQNYDFCAILTSICGFYCRFTPILLTHLNAATDTYRRAKCRIWLT